MNKTLAKAALKQFTACFILLAIAGCGPKPPEQDQLQAIFSFTPNAAKGAAFCREEVFPLVDGNLSEADRSQFAELQTLVKGSSGELVLHLILSRDGKHRITTRRWGVNNDWKQGKESFAVNGKEQLVKHYEAGYPHGGEKQYFPDGELMLSGQWLNGKRHGQWEANYATGQTGLQWQVKNDKLHGLITVYSADGEELSHALFGQGQPLLGSVISTPEELLLRLTSDPDNYLLPSGGYPLTAFIDGKVAKRSRLHIEYSEAEQNAWARQKENRDFSDYKAARKLTPSCAE